MSEYIKREEAYKAIKAQYPQLLDVGLRQVINVIPSADVVERPCWISVTDRLPVNNCNCIVFTKQGEVCEAHYYTSGKFYDPIEEYEQYNVTHWMPFPEPPICGTHQR